MASGYGMIVQETTLASLRLVRGQTVLEYGEKEIFEYVDSAYRAANAEMNLLAGKWCSFTNQRARRFGGGGEVEVEELTSTGRSQGETFTGGSEVGFPLRKFGKALGWTRDALRVTEVAEFAKWNQGIITGDRKNVIRRMKRAIYSPFNYDFYDRLIDGALLKVKALANGDGAEMPLGPNGNAIGPNHTHYLARAGGALAESDLDRLVGTLTEHYDNGSIEIEIDFSDESAVRLVNGFVPLLYANTVVPNTVLYDPTSTLDPMQPKNRVIGHFKGIQVATRYTAIPLYIGAQIIGPDIESPLSFRVRGVGVDRIGGDLQSIVAGGAADGSPGFGDLTLVYDHDDYPLRATEWHREFDVAANNRLAAAVLYIGGTTYVQPTIS